MRIWSRSYMGRVRRPDAPMVLLAFEHFKRDILFLQERTSLGVSGGVESVGLDAGMVTRTPSASSACKREAVLVRGAAPSCTTEIDDSLCCYAPPIG